MFNVLVSLRSGQWQFLFKERAGAENILNQYRRGEGSAISVEDDFGACAIMDTAAISGILIEDLDGSQEAGIERAMIQTKGQVKFQNKAKNDPLLKFAAPPNMNGPMPRIS